MRQPWPSVVRQPAKREIPPMSKKPPDFAKNRERKENLLLEFSKENSYFNYAFNY